MMTCNRIATSLLSVNMIKTRISIVVLLWLLLAVSGILFLVLRDVFSAVTAAVPDNAPPVRELRREHNTASGPYGPPEGRHGVATTISQGAQLGAREVGKEEEEEMEEEGEEKDGIPESGRDVGVSVAGGGVKTSVPHRGAIVYSCNVVSVCGGWADRQKGVVSAFVLSVLMDRPFKLDMPRPCDVTVYLAPREVDWVLAPGEWRRGTRNDVEGIDSHGYDLVRRMLEAKDLSLVPELQADYVFITWNMELVHLLRTHPLARTIPWLSPQTSSLADVYHHVLTMLFRPTPPLAAMLTRLQDARPPGSQLVCAQIRLGSSAAFTDSETFNTLQSVGKVIEHLRMYDDPGRYRILFASDNVQALKMARDAFPETFMETSGPVTHVDKYQGQDACAGLGRAILDQLMLSTCDVLIISESGLGKIAAFLRQRDDHLFLFHDSNISVFRRDLPFPNRLYW